MPLCWTMLPPEVDESQVVVVPLGLRQEHLQVSFSLLHRLTLSQAPPLGKAVDVRVHREGWGPASMLVLVCKVATANFSLCTSRLSAHSNNVQKNVWWGSGAAEECTALDQPQTRLLLRVESDQE